MMNISAATHQSNTDLDLLILRRDDLLSLKDRGWRVCFARTTTPTKPHLLNHDNLYYSAAGKNPDLEIHLRWKKDDAPLTCLSDPTQQALLKLFHDHVHDIRSKDAPATPEPQKPSGRSPFGRKGASPATSSGKKTVDKTPRCASLQSAFAALGIRSGADLKTTKAGESNQACSQDNIPP